MHHSIATLHGARLALLLVLLVATVGGCAARAADATPPASSTSPRGAVVPAAAAVLQSSDTLLLHAADAAVRITPAMAQAWPGFWSAASAFMIYRPGDAVLLVSPAAPPAGFLPVAGRMVPPALHGRAYLYRGALAGLEGDFHIDYPAGAVAATAVALGENVPATLTTLFHEAFHGYQSRRFARVVPDAGEYVAAADIAAPEYRAMAEVERRILAASLDLPADSARARLHEYLAVRQVRTRSVSDQARAVELRLERSEGSAHLVGLEAGLLARGARRERLTEAVRPYLTPSLDDFSGGLPERLIRWRVYGTGAAIGLLLDRMGEPWRAQLEQGSNFEALLADATGFETTTAVAVAERALERFGFADLLADAAAVAQTTTPASIEEFLALAPVRLVVEFNVPIENGRPDMTLNFSAGAAGFAQLEPNVFGIPGPDVYTLQLPHGSLVVRGLPLMQDMRELHEQRLRVTLMLHTVPAVDGGRQLTEGEHTLERLRIIVEGLELTVDAPVRVRVSPDEVLIRQGVTWKSDR